MIHLIGRLFLNSFSQSFKRSLDFTELIIQGYEKTVPFYRTLELFHFNRRKKINSIFKIINFNLEFLNFNVKQSKSEIRAIN
jgi:hypothetical protein